MTGIPPGSRRVTVVLDADDPGPDFELLWPSELFRAEAAALLRLPAPVTGSWSDLAELLLREAFAGEVAAEGLRAASWSDLPQLITAELTVAAGAAETSAREYLHGLAAVADRLLRHRPLRRYWGTPRIPPGPVLPGERHRALARDWAALVTELRAAGYLDRAAPRPCVDDDPPGLEPDERLTQESRERLGRPGLWPLHPEVWDADTLYGLVEVVHDLVARPRARRWHDFADCGWHYSSFALRPGRAVYRWRANQLLARHHTGLQLADSGEDEGRLVHAPGDDRDRLIVRALATPADADRDAVHHAVALFRGRQAGREEKRSAVVALARLLEDRRPLLAASLVKKDEGALFRLANEFDLRHRGATTHGREQHGDYDDAYLDWVFWWYLATIELTDRLLARQAGLP
jgi:hypothetical protein